MYYIYKVTNAINNKTYIGFTENPNVRWRNHKSSAKHSKRPTKALYKAMQKYGIDNFVFEIVYEHQNHYHTLYEMEPYFINKHNSFGACGYNMTKGGDDVSEKCRKTTSERMKINNPMTKLRRNSGSWKKGSHIPWTEERKEKAKIAKIGSRNPNYKNPKAAEHFHNKYGQCTKCGFETTIGNIARWHNDNCKRV